MKYIREARFGAPKTWKTGSILATYPKPMCVLMYDAGGHEIHKKAEDIEVITKVEALPTTPSKPITVLDLSFKASQDMEDTYTPAKDKDVFEQTVRAINALRKSCPYKTILVDPVTELSNAIWRHQAVANSAALADARKWAGNIGMKVQQVIDYVNALPCNTVFIFHNEVNKDELTGKITEQPMVYSNLRNYLGGKFTQFFYQGLKAGVPMLRTNGFELVQGIGCRWPTFTTEWVGPTFNDIYGKEPDVCK